MIGRVFRVGHGAMNGPPEMLLVIEWATSKPTVDADVSEAHDIDDVNVVGARGLI